MPGTMEAFGFTVGSPVYGIFVVAGASDAGSCSGAACGIEVTIGAGVVVDALTADGTVAHGAGAVVVEVVVVGGAVVVVAVVVGAAHGSTDVGARSAGAVSATVPGAVGVGVAETGCAMAPEVPDSTINAAVPAVNSDLDTERVSHRGGRRGLGETVVMGFLRSRNAGPNWAAS